MDWPLRARGSPEAEYLSRGRPALGDIEKYNILNGGGGGGGASTFLMEHMPKSTHGTFLSQKLKSTMVLF